MPLVGKLIELAQLWAEESGRSLPRLATKVVNDGKLFDRLTAGGTCTVATLERFTTHLSDPDQWPNRAVPAGAEALLARMGCDASSPDGPGQDSRERHHQHVGGDA